MNGHPFLKRRDGRPYPASWHPGIPKMLCEDGLCQNGMNCPAGRMYRGEIVPFYQFCPDDCGLDCGTPDRKDGNEGTIYVMSTHLRPSEAKGVN